MLLTLRHKSIGEHSVALIFSKLLRLPLSELTNQLAQGLWHLVLSEVVREGDTEVET